MAVLPVNMNEAVVKVRQISKQKTMIDSDYDEPIGEIVFENVRELSALIDTTNHSFEKLSRSMTGDEHQSYGKLVFRRDDLCASGVELKKGDIIIELAGVTTNFQIVEVRPESILDGSFLLTIVEFTRIDADKASV